MAQAGQVGLEWDAPTTNDDTTPLTDLKEYVVCVSPQPIPPDATPGDTGLDCSVVVPSPRPDPQPGETVQSPLMPCATALCYYRIAARDTTGNVSVFSMGILAEFVPPSAVPVVRVYQIRP